MNSSGSSNLNGSNSLLAKDFPPLGGAKSPSSLNGPSGVWSGLKGGTPSPQSTFTHGNPPMRWTGETLVDASGGPDAPSRYEEHDKTFERPPPKGAAELFNPGAGSRNGHGRGKGSGSGNSPPAGGGGSSSSGISVANGNSGSSSSSDPHPLVYTIPPGSAGAEQTDSLRSGDVQDRSTAVADAILVEKRTAMAARVDGASDNMAKRLEGLSISSSSPRSS